MHNYVSCMFPIFNWLPTPILKLTATIFKPFMLIDYINNYWSWGIKQIARYVNNITYYIVNWALLDLKKGHCVSYDS